MALDLILFSFKRTHLHTHIHTQTHKQTQTHTDTHRQTDRQTDTHTDTHRHTHRQTDTQTHTDRQTNTHTQTDTLQVGYPHVLGDISGPEGDSISRDEGREKGVKGQSPTKLLTTAPPSIQLCHRSLVASSDMSFTLLVYLSWQCHSIVCVCVRVWSNPVPDAM